MSTDQQLCAAAKAGNHAAAERLLESDDADPNAKDQHGGNPALSFAVAGGHTEVAALLIVRRADVAAAGEHGATALHIASQKGDTAAVELLLQHNAPLDAQDKNGATPLCRAAFDNQLECSSLLVLAGADVAITARGMTAQQLAEQKGHKKVAALLRDPAAAFRDHICAAAKAGSLVDVERLLDSGLVDANAKDKLKGRPVLCWACLNGHLQIAKLLLERGATVGMRSEELGWTEVHGAGDHTALHFTASFGRPPQYPTEEMVSMLLHHKAPLDVVNCQGATALFDSRLFNQPDTGVLLVRAGADPTVQSPRSGLAPVILPLVITDSQKNANVGETKETAAAIDAAIAECTLENVLAWWPEHLRAYATQMLATQARERGLRDDALLPGTRMKINAIGEGVYSGWDKSKMGANTHYIRIQGTVHKVYLKKLKAPQWSVHRGLSEEQVARDLEVEAAHELEQQEAQEKQVAEAKSRDTQPQETTAEAEPTKEAPDHLGSMPAAAAADSFAAELGTLTVGGLKKRAKALGATAEQIEEIDDADEVKDAAVGLVLLLRGALDEMKVSGLKKRLRALGESESQIEGLDDEESPKQAAIQRILEAASAAAAAGGGASQPHEAIPTKPVVAEAPAEPPAKAPAEATATAVAVSAAAEMAASEGHGNAFMALVSEDASQGPESSKRQLFGSMRFKNGGILPEAKQLRAELAKHDAPMQIVDMSAGGDIDTSVFSGIEACDTFVVFGTAGYGQDTGNPASTFYESKFAQTNGKRIILIRMIPFEEKFEHLQARQMFGVNKLCLAWIEGEPMPPTIVADIIKAIEDPSTAPK